MRWRPRFSLRTLVAFMLLVTSGVGLWSAGCIPTGEKTASRPRLKVFGSLGSAFSFMLFRDLVPDTEENRAIAKKSSRTSVREILDDRFTVVLFGYTPPGQGSPIYNANCPCYIFLERAERYVLVGEFLGSRVDLLEQDGKVVARVYYHFSAAETPHSDYPLENGCFNYLDPRARGDRFK